MEARVFVFVTGCRLIVVATVLLLAMPATAQPALPVIGTILENRGAIGLAASQIEALERLSLDFIREAIRRQADLLITQIDLDVLLDQDPSKTVDMKAAGAKVREIEKIRADLQLALIRAVEAARAQLTPEQRSKLAFWWGSYWFYAPPPVIVQAPPVYVQPPAPLYWYYCRSAQAYYPYVSSCPEPWVPVLATPQ
jgi:hypothetical protein